MSLKYKFVTAAASVCAIALPAAAQVAQVDAGVKVETPSADAQSEVEAGATAEAAPAGESREQSGAAGVAAATAADVTVGAPVLDPQGGEVGTIESVDAEGAVVSTGNARAKMPISSFGKNASGLVISMTRAELEAAINARGGPAE